MHKVKTLVRLRGMQYAIVHVFSRFLGACYLYPLSDAYRHLLILPLSQALSHNARCLKAGSNNALGVRRDLWINTSRVRNQSSEISPSWLARADCPEPSTPGSVRRTVPEASRLEHRDSIFQKNVAFGFHGGQD